VGEPWQQIQRESQQYLATPAAQKFDSKVAWVLVVAALMLTLQNYFGSRVDAEQWLRTFGLAGLADAMGPFFDHSTQWHFRGLVYWALFSTFTYVIPPLLVIVLVFREPLGNYGIKVRGAVREWWLYVVFFAVMWPLLLIVSRSGHFQETYPFYRLGDGEPLWPNFWRWELVYWLQFVGLEFFFRGFMVHGLKHRFGGYAIFVMMVPYCMIHYRKPLPETCGAIVAGIVLGFMSLKTRSIWLGAAIHITVAVSMDFLSLWRRGLIP
jgi:membrane protease YdiL (CAAX protease family)